jgi:hypothetical protein
MQCLLKILEFFGGLVGSTPTNLIPNFLSGLEGLTDCVDLVVPLGMFCFVRELLLLIVRTLLCAVKALESVLAILSGLEIQIGLAQQEGNSDLLAALQCAQQNAGIAAAGTMQSLQPITVLLTLAAPFLKIAQVPLNVSMPSAVPTSDLKAMQKMLDDLGVVATIIEKAAELVPCPS